MSKYKNFQPPQFLLDGTLVVQPPLAESFHKSQHLLGFTIDTLFLHTAINCVLFVTLTFPTPVRSTKAAQTRLNSFLNKVRRRSGNYLWVLQPHESGNIHFHLLIPVDFDAHDGTDLHAWRDKTFNDAFRENSMNPLLKAESDWWKATAPRFGFGRVEVAPIQSNAEAVRKYLTTQDWRDRPWPFIEKKSIRFWSCSAGLRAGNVNFAWNSPGGQACRARLKEWAHQHDCETYEELPVKLGKKWGYQFHQYILGLRAFEDLGIAPPPYTGSQETPPPAGRFSGRTGGVEGNVPQADLAPGPMMGIGSAGAVGACGDSRTPSVPSAQAGWCQSMPAATTRNVPPLCPCL